MAITKLGNTANQASTAATITHSLAAAGTLADGDLIVAFHQYARNPGTGYDHIVPTGFTERAERRINSTTGLLAVFEKISDGTETSVVFGRGTAEASGGSNVHCVVLRGVDRASPNSETVSNSTTSTTTTPAATFTLQAAAGSYLLEFFGFNTGSTFSSWNGGKATIIPTADATSLVARSAGKAISVAETPTGGGTLAASRQWATIGLVYAPAATDAAVVSGSATAAGFTLVGSTVAAVLNDSDTATYIETADNPTSQTVDLPLTGMADPGDTTNLRVKVTIQRIGGSTGTAVLSLINDASAVIGTSKTISGITVDPVEYTVVFPASELAGLSQAEWDDLVLRCAFTAV